MIRLITGTPGSGKTLYTISQIFEVMNKNPDRPIFSDISGLRIEGVQKAPDDWRDAPDGSLIIYDECHYREEYTKKRGRNNHPMIVDLTTHRHTGKDIWLITQNPSYLHLDILGLVGEHYHIDRPLKANFANVYKWRTAQTKPDGVTVRRRAETAPIFKYDKKLYQYYDSVDVDDDKANHKKSYTWLLNWRFLVLLGGVLLLAWAFYGIVTDGVTPTKDDEKQTQTTTQKATPQESALNVAIGAKPEQADLTKEQLEAQLKLQQEQFKFELEKQRTQLLLDYQSLQLQLIQQSKELQDFKRQLELFSTRLPKDYQIIKNNPDLQVRGVARYGDKCKAYNGQGVLMTLNQDECNYYLQESGRVWKSGQTQDFSPTEPRLPPSLTDNSIVSMVSDSQSQINATTENSGNLNK